LRDIKLPFSDWKDDIWIISAIIYVGGMFPLYYLYESNPANRYGLISDVSYISVAGAMILFLQLLTAAWFTKNRPKSDQST
jgi:hypothetical protein